MYGWRTLRSVLFALGHLLASIRTVVFVVAIAGLLALNIATVTFSSFAAAASGLANWLSLRSVYAVQMTDLRNERRMKESAQRQLSAERQRRLSAERRLRRSTAELDTVRRQNQVRRANVNARTRRVARRSVRIATRNASTLSLQSIPGVGVASIIAVTTLDVRDVCATARDMQEIRGILGEETEENSVGNEACEVINMIADLQRPSWSSPEECLKHVASLRELDPQSAAVIECPPVKLPPPDPRQGADNPPPPMPMP